MKRFSQVLLVAVAAIGSVAFAARDLHGELQAYFTAVLPGESFTPTPYGADGRFAPKTMWVYLDSAQAVGRTVATRKQSAWFVLSSGRTVYPDDIAPIQESAITLPTRDQDIEKKLALSAALAGTLLPKDVDAQLKLARDRGLAVDIELSEAQIVYCYYEDLISAQEGKKAALEKLTNMLRARYGKDLPRRVITAAIRAKGAKITVDADKKFDFSANAEVKALLSSIGFSWNTKSSTFDSLNFSDWRYIAYQALITDKEGRVSDAPAPGVDTSREANSLSLENRTGQLPR